jgi:hypothetical protein
MTGHASAAVNESIAIIRQQMERIKGQLLTADMHDSAILEGRFLALAGMVRDIEDNRASLYVQVMAGRRGLDKIPQADAELIEQALADFVPVTAPAIEGEK